MRKSNERTLRAIFLSSVLVFCACGDDDGGDDSPADPTPVLDAGGGEPDAQAPAPVDSGAPAADASTPTVADAGGSDAGRSDAGADAGGMSAAALRGEAIAEENACASCHTANYSGGGFYPNITPDRNTGIGSWSDDEIEAAITQGEGPDDDELCALMQRYELSATELSDLVAFLKSLPAVNKRISGTCPGS